MLRESVTPLAHQINWKEAEILAKEQGWKIGIVDICPNCLIKDDNATKGDN